MQLESRWASLRFRYTVSVVLLVVFVLTLSLFALVQVDSAQREVKTRLHYSQQLSSALHKLRINIQASNNHVDSFIIQPDDAGNADAIKIHLRRAIALVENLQSQENQLSVQFSSSIDRLYILLVQYSERVDHLFAVRLDALKQYPSLAIGNELMQPARRQIIDAFSVAVNNLQMATATDISYLSQYQSIIELRHLWTHTLSNFRLYIANRIGSFDLVALPKQEASVRASYEVFSTMLSSLLDESSNGELDFELSDALQTIRENTKKWFAAYLQVEGIHHQDAWRLDSVIMNNEIIPTIRDINAVLAGMEEGIHDVNSAAMNELSDAIRMQTNILGSSGLAILVILIVGMFSVYRFVMRPLADLVVALSKENTIDNTYHNSEETQVLITAYNDMVERVRDRTAALEHLALHDSLTELPNRVQLHRDLDKCIRERTQQGDGFSLLITDLDHFKEINDTLGHQAGDALLIEVAHRLRKVLAQENVVARLGGDEFAILLPDHTIDNVAGVCMQLQQSFEDIFYVEDFELYVGLSIGIACYPQHGQSGGHLLRAADMAMYEAKRQKSGFMLFNPELDCSSLNRLHIIKALRQAIAGNELQLVYQPIIELTNDTCVGVEALLRWPDPQYGELSTETMIELAEHTGLIIPLTYWVLEQAAKDAKYLHNDKGDALFIAVNISVYSMRDPQFLQQLENILYRYHISASRIRIEITESAMVGGALQDRELLDQLRQRGIHLVVDDFGVGYSSLAYLKQLPVESIKLDKSFILGMQKNRSDYLIVRSTVELARSLGLRVIAEGIESEEILDMLRTIQCDYVQGYHVARPVPLKELGSILDIARLGTIA